MDGLGVADASTTFKMAGNVVVMPSALRAKASNTLSTYCKKIRSRG